ncbi:MAG: extracellular solute-binding protein [Clostridia bacterium]|nr:extracellular solute-binding protein [Clostridia bacterium]
MKKVTTLLLVLLFVFAELILASCAEKPPVTPAGTEAVQTAAQTVVTEPAVTERLYPEVPDDLSFDDEPVTFLVIDGNFNGADWESQDIYQEHDSDEPIASAVYRRNTTIEEKYHVKIAQVEVSNTSDTARKSIKSNSDEYQVLMCDTKGTLSLATQKYLRDLNQIGGIDLSNPWWDQKMKENCSVGGKNFFATGDISIMDNDATWVLMFNKKIVSDYDLDDPYQLVRDNLWTYDKMYEMMNAVAGNGKGKADAGSTAPNWEKDMFGFVTHNSSLTAFYYAAGLKVVDKDDSDEPYFNEANNMKTEQVLEKSIKIWQSGKGELTWSADANGQGAVELQQVFEEGRGLFLGEVMQLVFRLREMNIDFGLIPFPKFDSNQKDYGHFVHSTSALLSIPTSCKEAEKVSYLVEAMACESMYTLTKAYYETALEGSYFRDPESAEMLPIILRSRTFDLGSVYMFDWGNVGSVFTSLLSSSSTAYSSTMTKRLKAAKTKLSKDVQKLEAAN